VAIMWISALVVRGSFCGVQSLWLTISMVLVCVAHYMILEVSLGQQFGHFLSGSHNFMVTACLS
jgi:hypothetical protein